ncbi:MAG: phosphoribosyl-AMP cyclohydrolase [Candidatus Helarchaeota archaeon]
MEDVKTFNDEEIELLIREANFTKSPDGLITVVAQDHETNQVLMVAFANEEAVRETLRSGIVTYWSRSRNKLWKKGETSGHVQKLKQVFIDCDGDCLLVKVEQIMAACHTGYYSCFYRELTGNEFKIIGEKKFNPKEVY